MKLHQFINEHMTDIIAEWTTFARKTDPAGDMSELALQDHAAEILKTIAADMKTRQSATAQLEKSQGIADTIVGDETAAATHGRMRHDNNFSLLELSAEFRALRATVLRLWLPKIDAMTQAYAYEMVRFNEAIDQALAESIVTYSKRADQTRELFLAILGHDLRAPLANVSMTADFLLLSNSLPDQNQLQLLRMKRSARLMASMVDDLLGYARTQMGAGMPMHVERIDITPFCCSAVEDASSMFPQCEFRRNFSGTLTGDFDGVRIQQLITNLLINAAQHGAKDHAVEFNAIGEEATVTISVQNFGIVIPEPLLSTMFEPLVQLEPENKDDATLRTSMGLGLFIASETAIAHNGTIAATSNATDGTIIAAQFPRTKAKH